MIGEKVPLKNGPLTATGKGGPAPATEIGTKVPLSQTPVGGPKAENKGSMEMIGESVKMSTTPANPYPGTTLSKDNPPK